MKRARVVPIVAATLLLGGIAVPVTASSYDWSEAETSVEARVYTASAKCQLVRISPNATIGYVEGYGEGNSTASARTNALKDVDRRVPAGHYKRHCQVTDGGRRGGGGRF